MAVAFILNPFRRGFFCDDESIQLPYFESTVPSTLLHFGMIVPVLLASIFALYVLLKKVFWVEYVKIKRETKINFIKSHSNEHKAIRTYYRNVYRTVICYANGVLYEYLLTVVGKVTVGRLRPNFIAVCGIDMISTCQNKNYGYISNYTCPSGDEVADDSRLSFPSGHACNSFYTAIFTVLYLQKRLQFGTLFWKPLVQFSIILLAWWVSLTRVMDNYHHMSDVIAGIFIGSAVAVTMMLFVYSPDKFEDSLSNEDHSDEKYESETRSLLKNQSNG